MLKTKLKTRPYDSKSINRTLFNAPFNPSLNFAHNDPLLLFSDPLVQKEGLLYAKYFCSNSIISNKAFEFLKKKNEIEIAYSQKANVEKTILLAFHPSLTTLIERSFLSSQQFFVPDSILSPFSFSNTTYFSHENPLSLLPLLEGANLNHIPVVYMPKICLKYGALDFSLFAKMKEAFNFFFIVEDHYTFSLDGITGFGKKSNHDKIDLLISHIPKGFGKLLTLLSANSNILDSILSHSFSNDALFFPAPYLGMFSAAILLIESMQDRREKLNAYQNSLLKAFHSEITIFSPIVSIYLDSMQEKEFFTKNLVDKGFLLPSTSFDENQSFFTLHLNYLLEEGSIHQLIQIKNSSIKQVVCQSI